MSGENMDKTKRFKDFLFEIDCRMEDIKMYVEHTKSSIRRFREENDL